MAAATEQNHASIRKNSYINGKYMLRCFETVEVLRLWWNCEKTSHINELFLLMNFGPIDPATDTPKLKLIFEFC
jgi:hypothetical protein